MTRQQAQNLICEILGAPLMQFRFTETSVEAEPGNCYTPLDLTFTMMHQLAAAFGTDRINFYGDPGSPGYSEYTPGDCGSVCITITRTESWTG